MFGFFLAALSLAPLGVFLLFWRIFARDRGIHPIYRESGIEAIGKRTEAKDAAVRRPPIGEVERNGKVARSLTGSPPLRLCPFLVLRPRDFESYNRHDL